jgi:hypothetical protein
MQRDELAGHCPYEIRFRLHTDSRAFTTSPGFRHTASVVSASRVVRPRNLLAMVGSRLLTTVGSTPHVPLAQRFVTPEFAMCVS